MARRHRHAERLEAKVLAVGGWVGSRYGECGNA